MELHFDFDVAQFLSDIGILNLEEKLPEFVAKTLSVSFRDKIESRIREKIGSGGFGQELAEGIRTKADNTTLVVDHESNDSTHIAEHVHCGGIIRPKTRKYLAIPIDASVRDEYPSDHTWLTNGGKPIFLRRKAGRGWIMAESRGRGKTQKLKPLFVLVPQTKPQKPRPIWFEEKEAWDLIEREVAFWLNKTIGRSI